MASERLLLVFFVVLLLQTFTSSSTLYFAPKYVAKMKMEIFPFQNMSLAWNDRVDDLVSRLTLDEIQLQMARGGAGEFGGPAPAIPRLGIGPYNWDTECLRGDVEAVGNATSFPQAIGLGAMFSPELLFQVAAATGQEVRGKHNDFVRKGVYATHTGASCFSPVINIARDPRWGRNQETYGEDPFLSGELAKSYVWGLQGNDPRYIQASSGCKHFDVHGGPENIPASRFSFDALVSDRDWRMTFLPAFRKCVKAGTFNLMCSYNSVNGVPACANKKLLTDILRDEWNFTGYVVSDQGAIENIEGSHHYLNNSVDIAAACVNAGCNLELSGNNVDAFFMSIVDAVKQGKLKEEVVRERVKPLFYTRMRLGEFDPPDSNPFAKLDSSVVENQEHRDLAVETAMKSFVLLKNQNNILPLKQDAYKNVAIIGPMADNVDMLFGDYRPNQDRSFIKTPLQGIRELYPNAANQKACGDGTPCKTYDSAVVKKVVDGADLVFVTLGTGPAVEAEGNDRPDVELAGHQKDLILDVMKYNDDAKIILLLFNAGPLNVTFADESDRVNAIMECFLPAQATGDALINVLTNKGGNSSPAGRLPITWPKFDSQLLSMLNYSMEGRTYRYMETDPLYPFGYGLSYSKFYYSVLNYNKTISATDDLIVSFSLSNNGNLDADEVVQCYISWDDQSLPVPVRQLAYFNRIHVTAGQTMSHMAVISTETMMFWDNGKWVIKAGTMHLYCGGQQSDQKRSAPSNILSGQFTITDTVYMDKF